MSSSAKAKLGLSASSALGFSRSAGIYGISPLWNAASCFSRDPCRMSTSCSLTQTFQTTGLSPNRLGRVQSGLSRPMPNILRIASDLPWPPLSDTPKTGSMSINFMCGDLLGSSRTFAQPMVRTIPQAQTSTPPRVKGVGRFRARARASRRHILTYSSFKYRLQKASVKPTIALSFDMTSSDIAVDDDDLSFRAMNELLQWIKQTPIW